MPGKFVAAACALLATVFAALQGCATGAAMSIDPGDRAAIASAPAIYVGRYISVPLDVMSPATVAGGGLLASATGWAELPSGLELQRTYRLPGGAEELSDQLVQKLKAQGRLSNLRVERSPLPLPWVEDVSRYKDKYPTGLVLEITATQSAGYQAMHWQTYNFSMFGKVRLIRVADGKVLWKDICSVSGHDDDALTLDVTQFEAENGARLKQLIHYSSDRCSQILADKFLGKNS